MNKKYLISITLLLIAILLIVFGIVIKDKTQKEKPVTTPTNTPTNNNEYTYDEAKNIGESLYQRETNQTEVTEEEDGYHIIIKDKETGKKINEVIMDKSGNIVSEKPSGVTNGGEIVEN